MEYWTEKRNDRNEKALNEIMAENFSNLAREMNLHSQESEQTTNRANLKKPKPAHSIIKLLKNNQRKHLESWDSDDTLSLEET